MPNQREAPAVKTDHIIKGQADSKYTVPNYRYHILNSQGLRVESNLPDEHHATAVIEHLATTDPLNAYTVEQEQIYSRESTRLGRDPDLH